jgi:hypothetical protein
LNQLNINTDIPSKNEIKVALSQLKNNKAAGRHGILAEILKADKDVTANLMLPLLQAIWTQDGCLRNEGEDC